MNNDDLPEWATKMTDAEWKASEKQLSKAYTHCAKCGKRLILSLCRNIEPVNYCVIHCPRHKWQSDYDWQTECAKCGIEYSHWLQKLLDDAGITYSKP